MSRPVVATARPSFLRAPGGGHRHQCFRTTPDSRQAFHHGPPETVVLPGGERWPLHAMVVDTSLYPALNVSEEGAIQGKGHDSDDWKNTGVGAGGGAVIGALAGGGVGALAGAAIGTAAARFTGWPNGAPPKFPPERNSSSNSAVLWNRRAPWPPNSQPPLARPVSGPGAFQFRSTASSLKPKKPAVARCALAQPRASQHIPRHPREP